MNDFKRIPSLFISVAIIALALLFCPVSGQAEEQGGAVQTNGVISFYDSTPPSSTTEPSDSTPEPSSSSEPGASTIPSTSTYPSTGVTKPAGSYPSTGEMIKASLGISGAVLVGIVLLLFYMKRKKEHSAGKGGE